MISHRSLSEDLVEILVRSSLKGPRMIFIQARVRRSCGDPGKILSRVHCMKILQMLRIRCLSESSSGVLLGGSCFKILYDPLQQQQVLLCTFGEIFVGVLI